LQGQIETYRRWSSSEWNLALSTMPSNFSVALLEAQNIIVPKSMLEFFLRMATGEAFLINGRKDANPIVDDRPPVHHAVLESIVNERK